MTDIIRIPTANGPILVVTDNGKATFQTIDDCFGLDRIQSWATINHLDFQSFERIF